MRNIKYTKEIIGLLSKIRKISYALLLFVGKLFISFVTAFFISGLLFIVVLIPANFVVKNFIKDAFWAPWISIAVFIYFYLAITVLISLASIKYKLIRFLALAFVVCFIFGIGITTVGLVNSFKENNQKPVVVNIVSAINLQNSKWDGNGIFSGELKNNNPKDIFNTKIEISISKNKDKWVPIETRIVAIPFVIKSNDIFAFNENVSLPSDSSTWWRAQVSSAEFYNGQKINVVTNPVANIPSVGNSSQNNAQDDGGPWGVSKQVTEHMWTIKLGNDAKMATSKEIYDALNNYRLTNGSGYLAWDDNLAKFAQSRADNLNKAGELDEHRGFEDCMKNPDCSGPLNFHNFGENVAQGQLSGVHIIEWQYAGDKPHNDNQLDRGWTHVGIGVSGIFNCLIFAK